MFSSVQFSSVWVARIHIIFKSVPFVSYVFCWWCCSCCCSVLLCIVVCTAWYSLFFIHAHSLLLFCSILFCCYWKFQTFCFVPVRLINISPHSCIYTTALIVKIKRKKTQRREKLFIRFSSPSMCLPACLLAFFCFLRTQFSINSAFYVLFFLFTSFSVCSFRCNVICWCAAIAGSAFVVHSCHCRSVFLLMSSFYRCFVRFRFNSVLDWYVHDFEISQAELRTGIFTVERAKRWCVFGLTWLHYSVLFFCAYALLSLFVLIFSLIRLLIRWLLGWLARSLILNNNKN